MKDKAYHKKKAAFLAGSIVSLWLVTSPLAAFSGQEKDGGCDSHDKWMTRPFDATDAISEPELMVEDWMTRPFDATDAISETELMVEDWMTRPFSRTGSEYGVGWALR